MATRFFDVDVLASLAAENRRRAVPMIGRSADQSVYILVSQDRLEISRRARLLACLLLKLFIEIGQTFLVDIAQRGDFHSG
jgi:predicted Mrr-cat superfamily restriction endonuclease